MDRYCQSRAPKTLSGPNWSPCRAAVFSMWLAACAASEPGPVEFVVTADRVARASCAFPYDHCVPDLEDQAQWCGRARDLAEKASTSVIAIDERGSYAPVFFTFPEPCAPQPVRQPMPGLNCAPKPEGPVAEKFTDCFVQHAKDIRGKLQSPPSGKRYHLLVFIHGGLNLEQNRLERAFVDAHRMLEDQGVAGAAPGRLDDGEIWYPLFITWPSADIQSYVDQRVHYNQGDYDSDFKRLSSPLYFLSDAVESVVRAPVAWVESVSWFQLGQDPAVARIGNEIGCEGSGPGYRCVPLRGRDERSTSDEIWYWSPLGLAGRLVSVPVVDAVGQPTWDAMLSRTRMLMRKPFNTTAFEREDERPPITLIGHSMGAIVVDEILRNFPDLPYRNIVFIGAAPSVRDTISALDQVTRAQPRRDLRFYNLSLHQVAEANEVGYLGAVARGSLLE
jgi:hypothetical protein